MQHHRGVFSGVKCAHFSIAAATAFFPFSQAHKTDFIVQHNSNCCKTIIFFPSNKTHTTFRIQWFNMSSTKENQSPVPIGSCVVNNRNFSLTEYFSGGGLASFQHHQNQRSVTCWYRRQGNQGSDATQNQESAHGIDTTPFTGRGHDAVRCGRMDTGHLSGFPALPLGTLTPKGHVQNLVFVSDRAGSTCGLGCFPYGQSSLLSFQSQCAEIKEEVATSCD